MYIFTVNIPETVILRYKTICSLIIFLYGCCYSFFITDRIPVCYMLIIASIPYIHIQVPVRLVCGSYKPVQHRVPTLIKCMPWSPIEEIFNSWLFISICMKRLLYINKHSLIEQMTITLHLWSIGKMKRNTAIPIEIVDRMILSDPWIPKS